MISTKGRYALRTMIDLAQHDGEKSIPLKDIAERQDISKKYLEIIVKELVRAGFLTGVSGRGGGYRLSRRPDEYNVGEILEVMEGSLAPVACLGKECGVCARADHCETLPMWKEFNQIVHDYFYGKKLSDLAGCTAPVYYI